MTVNFQKETDRILETLSERPRLLLHSCCGPCSTYALSYLTQYFDVTILYYNPNIQPAEEYEKRLSYQRRVLEHIPAKILECDYDGDTFNAAVRGLETEPEGGTRCTVCFRLRLEETARQAAAYGFPWYCTTLTVSPHKDAARINQLGREIGEAYGVHWLPSDFKKRDGYLQSIRMAAAFNLYRQNYCGCVYSQTGVL